jgi:hypothetical protein
MSGEERMEIRALPVRIESEWRIGPDNPEGITYCGNAGSDTHAGAEVDPEIPLGIVDGKRSENAIGRRRGPKRARERASPHRKDRRHYRTPSRHRRKQSPLFRR